MTEEEIQHMFHNGSEHIPLTKEELSEIDQQKIVRACIYLYRLAPWFFNFINHYGVLIELDNGERYLIHNSPNNFIRHAETKPKGGHEIISTDESIRENSKNRWELYHDWVPVKDQTICPSQLLNTKLKYRFMTTNCIHTTKRVWYKIAGPEY